MDNFYPLALTLHVLGAAIWVGGHLLLSIRYLPKALRRKNVGIIQQFEQQYEPVGIPALLVQVLTGLWIAFGHYDLTFLSFQTGMARAVSIKLLLLLATLGLAVHARFFIIPRLGPDNLHLMAAHAFLVTAIGVAMLVVGVWFRFGGI